MNKSLVFIYSANTIGQNSPNLAGILAKARLGEQEAFSELYNLYFKKIYRFIYFRVSHKEAAEDLAEEVFIKLLGKLRSLKDDKSFEGWLYQIARNLVIDYYRQKKSDVALQEVENTLIYESNILDTLQLEERQKILLELMKDLSSEQQIVLKLKFYEQLENAEIAALLNKNEGSIRVIQHRAITKLQELLKNSKPDPAKT